MADAKLTYVDGGNTATCNQEMYWVRSTAQLYMFVDSLSGWRQVGDDERVLPNTNYSYADAVFDCKGLGQRSFYTRGQASAGGYGGYHFESPWKNSAYSNHNCGAPPPVPIRPGP
jgi:hypothetical protein